MPKLRERDAKVQARLDAWSESLREARIAADLSLFILARDANVPHGSLSDWEKGRRLPPVWAQIQLCEAMELPVAAVFPRDDAEQAVADLARKRRLAAFPARLEAEQRRIELTDVRFGGAS